MAALSKEDKLFISNYITNNYNNLHFLITNDGMKLNGEKIPYDVFNLYPELQKLKLPIVEWSPNLTEYSPLELDRSSYTRYWKSEFVEPLIYKDKINIKFPLINSVFLTGESLLGAILDFIDYIDIYIKTFLEVVPQSEIKSINDILVDPNYNLIQKENIILKDGSNNIIKIYPNKILRFKPQFLCQNLIFDQFSTEQIINRLYKAYGSIVRDTGTVIVLNKIGVKLEYFTILDINKGIDIRIWVKDSIWDFNEEYCYNIKLAVDSNASKNAMRAKELKRNNFYSGNSNTIYLYTTYNDQEYNDGTIVLPSEDFMKKFTDSLSTGQPNSSYYYRTK